MPFQFKLLQPPSDISFISIVDGETLYNSKGKHTHDLKEATLRQIGWHVAQLPIEWFCSDRAHTTVERVLETMQCTIQYLWHETQAARQRADEKERALQDSNVERDNAFEELVGLRETVALYALSKHRDRAGAGAHRRRSEGDDNAGNGTWEEGRGGGGGGLACTLCGNEYPSKNALESHFRKRHKRTPEFAAIAAAQAATTQSVNIAKGTPSHLYVQLPGQGGGGAGSGSSLESRGVLAMREELSELRLTIAKLVEQKAEQQRAMAPTHMVGHPAAGGLPCLDSDPLEKNPLSSEGLAEQMTALKQLVLKMNERLEQGVTARRGSSVTDAPPAHSRGAKRLGIPPPLEAMNPAFLVDTNYDSLADIDVSPMTQRSPSMIGGARRNSQPQTFGNSLSATLSGPRQVTTGAQTPHSSPASSLADSRHSVTTVLAGSGSASARVVGKLEGPLTAEAQPDVHFSLPLLPKPAEGDRYNEELSTIASRHATPRAVDMNTSQGESGMVLSDTSKTNPPTLSSPNPTDNVRARGSSGPEISVSPRGRTEDVPAAAAPKTDKKDSRTNKSGSPLEAARVSKPPIPVVQLVAKDSPPHPPPPPSALEASDTPKAPESLMNSHYSLFDDYYAELAPMQTSSALVDGATPEKKRMLSPQPSFAASDTEARKLADENVPAFGEDPVKQRRMQEDTTSPSSSVASSSSSSSSSTSEMDTPPVEDVENEDLGTGIEELTLESQRAETNPENRSSEGLDEEEHVMENPVLEREKESSSSYSYYYTYSEEGEEAEEESEEEEEEEGEGDEKRDQKQKPSKKPKKEATETDDEEEEEGDETHEGDEDETSTDDRKGGKGADVKAGLKKIEGTLKNKMSKFKKLFDKKKKK